MPVYSTIVNKPALVAEIVGPAGAGKTSLLRRLRQCNEEIRVGVRLGKIKYLPLFAHHTLLSLPAFLRQSQTGKWFTYREMKLIVYLEVFHYVLERHISNNGTAIVLDQGPIYKLARLHGFGPKSIQNQDFEKWQEGMLNHWTSTLGLIIQLDAPDSILMERIRSRNTHHRVQKRSEQETSEFLARYRRSYAHIISKLSASSSIKVLRFDTSQEKLEQIVSKVLAAFNTEHATNESSA